MVMVSTKIINKRPVLLIFLISLLGLLGCVFLSSPAQNISSVVVFFICLFAGLLSISCLFLGRLGLLSAVNFYKAIVAVGAFVLLVMFHGAQSLTAIGLLVTLLIIVGLSFYISRRA